MKAGPGRLPFLVAAAAVFLAAGRARADSAGGLVLCYRFAKGQEFVVTADSSAQQNQLSSGRVVSEGRVVVRELGMRCKVTDVNADGDATIEATYARMAETVIQQGFGLRIDSAMPVAESNPDFAKMPRAKTDIPKLEQVRSVFQAMVGLSYKFTVSKSGRIMDVEGFDDVMDAMREQLAARTQDASVRAQADMLLEAFAGADEGRQNAANLFVPYPADSVARGQAWSTDLVAPFVVPPVGQWKVPETRTYAIEYGGEPGQSAVVSGSLTYGAPDKPGGAELDIGAGSFGYCAILDPANGGTMVREFHTASKVNIGVYPAGAQRQLAGEFQMVSTSEVYWDLAKAGGAGKAAGPAPNPAEAGACLASGNAKLASGDLDGAISDFDRALILNANDNSPGGRREIAFADKEVVQDALAEAKAGDWDHSIADFSRVIEISPRWGAAYGKRGYMEALLGRGDDAVADMSRAAEIQSTNAGAYYLLGLVKLAKKDFDGSIAEMTHCVALDPRFAKAYFFRSMAWSLRGDAERGAPDFEKAIGLDPTLAEKDGEAALSDLAPLIAALGKSDAPSTGR